MKREEGWGARTPLPSLDWTSYFLKTCLSISSLMTPASDYRDVTMYMTIGLTVSSLRCDGGLQWRGERQSAGALMLTVSRSAAEMNAGKCGCTTSLVPKSGPPLERQTILASPVIGHIVGHRDWATSAYRAVILARLVHRQTGSAQLTASALPSPPDAHPTGLVNSGPAECRGQPAGQSHDAAPSGRSLPEAQHASSAYCLRSADFIKPSQRRPLVFKNRRASPASSCSTNTSPESLSLGQASEAPAQRISSTS